MTAAEMIAGDRLGAAAKSNHYITQSPGSVGRSATRYKRLSFVVQARDDAESARFAATQVD